VQEGPAGFTVLEAALSIISSIIGGGIISIPYAMTTNGLFAGAIIHLTTICFLMFTTHLYLQSK
jgi:amino acid permease